MRIAKLRPRFCLGGGGRHRGKRASALTKIAVVLSSVTLAGGYVMYRARAATPDRVMSSSKMRALTTATRAVKNAHRATPTTTPTSQPAAFLMPGSKSDQMFQGRVVHGDDGLKWEESSKPRSLMYSTKSGAIARPDDTPAVLTLGGIPPSTQPGPTVAQSMRKPRKTLMPSSKFAPLTPEATEDTPPDGVQPTLIDTPALQMLSGALTLQGGPPTTRPSTRRALLSLEP